MRRPSRQAMPQSPIVMRLDAMTYGGDAIGRADGKAIFVQGGIAGELVRAEIVEERGRFARARVVEVIAASPDRVLPRCPHFGFEAVSCGGCHWQHVDYAAQVRFKTAIVREQLRRIGRIDDAVVRDTLPSPDVWAYRNQAQFGVAPAGRLGFRAAHSHRVVPIDECHIIRPPIAAWLKATSAQRGDRFRHVARIDARAFNSEQGSVEVWDTSASNFQPPASNLQIKSATFRVSAGSFFQVNTSLVETLVDQVVSRLALCGGEIVLDAYCGVGLFSRFIAPTAQRVIGVESSPAAIADARANLAQFENVDLREGLVETVLLEIEDGIDAAIVDPPRAGCGPPVIKALIDRPLKRLVYVSCDPSTLARDARQLIDSGYALIEVQPLDMFPQTYHIESIALFARSEREA